MTGQGVFVCWCGWQDDGEMTHDESLEVNDFQFGERAPWHLPSEEWNVPETGTGMSDAYRPMAAGNNLPLGPRMTTALEFIKTHPGVTMREVYDNCPGQAKPFGGRPNYLHRLIRRGLVYNLGRCNRAALYAWQEPDQQTAHP
jgi:hypothetical protein